MHAFNTALRAGAKAVLIDQGPLGTTCARVGCMPSKAMLHAAHRWGTLQSLLPANALLPEGSITPQQLWTQALAIRDELVAGNVRQVHALGGAGLLQAHAQFVAPDTLALSDGRTVRARAFVVATGSQAIKPLQLQAQLGDALITTDELFYLSELPRRVAVMGTGAIGLEMGVALARLGVDVAAAGRASSVAKVADPLVAAAATRYFAAQLPMALGCADITFTHDAGSVVMRAGALQHRADYVLVALGRQPRLEGLQVQAARVQLDAKGRPVMERESLRCASTTVFLAGDAAPGAALMHEAGHEGTLAAQQALAALGWRDVVPRQRTVPMSIVFSDPDIAEVGVRFTHLPPDAVIGCVEGTGSGRSKLMEAPHHVLRLYAERSTGKLLGASMLCARGEHLAHLLAWAIQRGQTVDDLLGMPYYHPTMEEMINTALREIHRALRAA